jgi:hypothetical protein
MIRVETRSAVFGVFVDGDVITEIAPYLYRYASSCNWSWKKLRTRIPIIRVQLFEPLKGD